MHRLPPKLRRIVERICHHLNIDISEGLYIANMIAPECGIGDGHGQFTGDINLKPQQAKRFGKHFGTKLELCYRRGNSRSDQKILRTIFMGLYLKETCRDDQSGMSEEQGSPSE